MSSLFAAKTPTGMRDMRALLLRMNLMRADFIVKGEVHDDEAHTLPRAKGSLARPYAAGDPC